MNIGQFITYMILNSTKTNSEILSLVHQNFEGCKTSPACIAWYKTKLRKEGKLTTDKAQKFKIQLTAEELEALTK